MKPIIILVLLYVSITYSQMVPNLPEPRCSGVAEVINDTLYFFGGANRHYLGSTRYQTVYKLNGNNWIVYDSILDDNTLGMGSVVVGNDIYLFGGYRFGNRVVRKYDLPNKTWMYMNPGPNFSSFGSTFEYTNDHVYAFLTSGDVYEYNLLNDIWIEKSPNTVPGFSLSSEVYQNEVYIIGYYDSTFSHPFYKYNPVTDSWTELANLPYQVVKCAMEFIGDKLYCVGGSEQGGPPNQFDTLLVYDILSNSWSIDQFELTSKRVWMADVTYENKFLVLGGIDIYNYAVDTVEEITPLGVISSLSELWEKPNDFNLYQNYPNPFNPSTTIKFALPVDSRVKINVYNSLGQLVETLVDKEMESGYHEIDFDASRLASGVYLYQLQSQDFISAKKMLLIK